MDTKNVLIVEDDTNITELLSIHLSDLVFKVVSEKNGQNGLARAQDESFDLIILDVMLPGLNGMEICRKIRQADRQTPIGLRHKHDRRLVNGRLADGRWLTYRALPEWKNEQRAVAELDPAELEPPE